MIRTLGGVVLLTLAAVPVLGQTPTPQPFPRPGAAQPQTSTPAAPRPSPSTAPPPAVPAPAAPVAAPAAAPQAAADPDAPTAAALGFPIYPAAQFLASYDAGRGQRYYLFGTTGSYADLVTYYRTQLKEKGDQVFEQPPTYTFQIGKFRDELMAFPAGVTVKDWTWGGSQGYPNPKRGAQPARFPTVLMIVPAPPAAAPAAR